jgi:hypothetical protein
VPAKHRRLPAPEAKTRPENRLAGLLPTGESEQRPEGQTSQQGDADCSAESSRCQAEAHLSKRTLITVQLLGAVLFQAARWLIELIFQHFMR